MVLISEVVGDARGLVSILRKSVNLGQHHHERNIPSGSRADNIRVVYRSSERGIHKFCWLLFEQFV